jgi:lipoprotein-anchoring transpeptidase ErfK/SrfK
VDRKDLSRRAALVAGVGVLTAACTSQPDKAPGKGVAPGEKPPEPPPVAKITTVPAVGAKDVDVVSTVRVTVEQGELTKVAVTNAKGRAIEGELAADKRSWKSTEVLGYQGVYTYSATALGTDRKTATLGGAFHTLAPAQIVTTTINPVDDQTVGVGMPISVKFQSPVANKAAVEKALTVDTSPKVTGSWAWLHPQQVDWRPKEYWPAGTKVTVTAKLYGVKYGKGAYGNTDLTTKFTVGRNQVVKVHTPDHEMRVYREGKLHASYPSSNGKDGDPALNTPNGTFIVMSKAPKARFDNARYGYTNVWKTYAVRFANTGEFIHENNDNAANIGKVNTSHGCVNLLGTDAKAYYESALIGDPVEVTGATRTQTPGSDVYDWLIPWSEWKSMSELA